MLRRMRNTLPRQGGSQAGTGRRSAGQNIPPLYGEILDYYSSARSVRSWARKIADHLEILDEFSFPLNINNPSHRSLEKNRGE